MELIKGCMYKVIASLPFGDQLKGDEVIYLGSESDWMVYDRFPEYLMCRIYHLYNPETGKVTKWHIDGKEEFQALQIPKYLKQISGGWIRPKPNTIVPLPKERFEEKVGMELLKEYVPYFKSIVEVDPNTYNFYFWLEEHENLLKKVFSGGDKLRFRIEPFVHLQKILENFSVGYTIRDF